MTNKELTIRWNSCELATDVDFQCELKFDVGSDSPEEAYQKAIAAMRACLISEGAQIDPAVLGEVK